MRISAKLSSTLYRRREARSSHHGAAQAYKNSPPTIAYVGLSAGRIVRPHATNGLARMAGRQSIRMRAKLMVALDPWHVPSSSRVLEGGEPARIVAVKKSVNGFFSGTGTALLAEPSGRISSRRFYETDLPADVEPLT